MRRIAGWKWRALLCLALLLLILSGPRTLAVFVALALPLLLPSVVLLSIAYRLKRRWHR
jgi:hypothetical protein